MSVTHVTVGGIAPSYGYFKFTPDRISVTPLLVGQPDILIWKEAIEPHLEMARLIGFARGTVATPEEHYPDLRAEFCAVQLLTFTVISRWCSPGVQIALKSCREYLDAGHRAWHFIESTYQVTDALYIGQLEEQLSHIRMGEEETATDYCNWARRILATMRMAGVHYSTASYLTHVIKGLTSSYSLLKRLSLAPSTRAILNKDSLTSYILQDEAMQEAERFAELLAQVNYIAPVKQGGRPRQRGQSGSGDSSGWKPTKDADKKKSAKDSGRGGGRGNKPRKENQSTSAMDADSSAGGKGRDDKEAACSLVGVVEPIVSLAPEAGEEFQAMAAAVQANPEVVLLDSGCSHHLMGTKAAFVDLGLSGDVKHVCGFNGALQDVQGRGTFTLQGEAGKQVLIPDVLYVPGVEAQGRHWAGPQVGIGCRLTVCSCIGGKLARHTFPDQGSDAADVLAVVHIDLCGPFRVAAKDGSLYFLLLKDRKTRYMWKSVLMLCTDRGGEFIGKQFTDFVDGKGIIHDLTCPYTPQQNGMAEWEMCTMVESVRTMLLHMGVQHHWWHLALRQAIWVRNCLERSALPPGTTPYQLFTGTNPNLSMAPSRAAPGGPLATLAALLAAPCGPPTASCCCLPSALRCPASPRSECCTAMASLCVLAFDHEGRSIQFDTWLDDLQLYLLSDSRDSVLLFCGAAPPTTADSATRSQWLIRDAAARLAIRNHLLLAECTHFGQHRTAQALYDAVLARYSSLATAALGRLLLAYLFPELSAFATVEDLVSHLCASDARYRAAAPADFLDRNQPARTAHRRPTPPIRSGYRWSRTAT
ncbi:unnamed protein product [Closterium sp. NIES-53]